MTFRSISAPRRRWLPILIACIEEADGDAGLSRESLYKALSGDRSPGFDTILKVVGALGLKLHAEAAQP